MPAGSAAGGDTSPAVRSGGELRRCPLFSSVASGGLGRRAAGERVGRWSPNGVAGAVGEVRVGAGRGGRRPRPAGCCGPALRRGSRAGRRAGPPCSGSSLAAGAAAAAGADVRPAPARLVDGVGGAFAWGRWFELPFKEEFYSNASRTLSWN